MNNDIAISVQNLTKVYKLYNKPLDRLKESINPFGRIYHHHFHALKEVSFDVMKGETIGIIGKNGSGKSTLLKLITGVLNPTSGCVSVNGKISALLELGAGFNPQMTGIENIYFNGTLMGYSKEDIDRKLDSILAFADIGEFVYQPVKTYSSGMFIRLAFAVAINVEPEILIVDEALSVGDALFQAKCLTVIDRFRQNGTAVLYVTHDTSSIKSLCSKAVYLIKGHVAAIGKAGQVADQYIRDLREESGVSIRNNSHTNPVAIENGSNNVVNTIEYTNNFKFSEEFEKKAAFFRYGSGEVRFVNAEILDRDGNHITQLKFNDVFKIRLYLKCYKKARFSVNYIVRDGKNNNIIGSNLRIENVELVEAEPDDKYIVEYVTRAPLAAGPYSLYVEITNPLILNQRAMYIDVVANALLLHVLERPVAKIWTQVYIDNSVTIQKLSNP